MTSALSITNLAELMRDIAARAFDPGLRYANESDAVLYGKLVAIDAIAEPHYTSLALAPQEERLLAHAAAELHRAFNHLADRVLPSPSH